MIQKYGDKLRCKSQREIYTVVERMHDVASTRPKDHAYDEQYQHHLNIEIFTLVIKILLHKFGTEKEPEFFWTYGAFQADLMICWHYARQSCSNTALLILLLSMFHVVAVEELRMRPVASYC